MTSHIFLHFLTIHLLFYNSRTLNSWTLNSWPKAKNNIGFPGTLDSQANFTIPETGSMIYVRQVFEAPSMFYVCYMWAVRDLKVLAPNGGDYKAFHIAQLGNPKSWNPMSKNPKLRNPMSMLGHQCPGMSQHLVCSALSGYMDHLIANKERERPNKIVDLNQPDLN